MDNRPTRARLLSDDCEVLIAALNRELITVKDLLTNLTQSLNVSVNVPRPSTPYTPVPLPTTDIFWDLTCPRDVGWSVAVSSDQPPVPLPRVSRKVQKVSAMTRATTPVPAPAPAPDISNTLHLLRIVDEREDERAQIRGRYLCLMRNHIEQQLQDLVERESLFKKRKKRREKKAKSLMINKKPVRFRSTGESNTAYLENLYQSCLYKIIAVEQGMKKSGRLKTASDVKAFWERMLTPLKTGTAPQQQLPTISVEKELEPLEEEDCTNSWALTVTNPEMTTLTPTKLGERPTPVPSPLRFTPCKLPELKPIKDILDTSARKDRFMPPVTRKAIDSDCQGHWSRQRTLMKRVYQRAKANEIAMRTLLPRGTAIEHPSFNVCDTCTSGSLPPIPMVLPPLPQAPPTCGGVHDPIMPDSNTKLKHSIKNQDLHLKCIELSKNKSILSQSSNLSLHPLSVSISASKESFSPTSHVKSPSKPVYTPLTMEELEETNHTRVTSGKSFLWSNYMPTGKSVT